MEVAMAVGPRVSKEEFMHALGLDANNPQHEPYYRAMRVSRLILARSSQLPQLQANLLSLGRSHRGVQPDEPRQLRSTRQPQERPEHAPAIFLASYSA